MNFVHLYKHLCSNSAWKSVNSSEHVIRPFIKAPATLPKNVVNFKRSFATQSQSESGTSKQNEEPSLFGKSKNRIPPDLKERLEVEEIMAELDEWIDEIEDQTGSIRIPYTVDMRDQIKVNTTLDVGRHTRVTSGGRMFSYSALVLLGTGNGTAGIGYGKSEEVSEAVAKATIDAQKRMISITRWHQKLPHTIISRYRGTKVVMLSKKHGSGVSGHPTLQLVAEAFGLQDITCKTFRSRNTRKIVAAMVYGILKNANLHPVAKAKAYGRKLVSWEDYWKPPPPNDPVPVRKDWSTTAKPTSQERHENLEVLATASGIDIYKFAREYGIDLSYKDTILANFEVDETIADKDLKIFKELEAEKEEEAPRQRRRDEEEDQDEEVDEEVVEEDEEDFVGTEDTEPDVPGVFMDSPLVEKTLEQRITRETKVAPLK